MQLIQVSATNSNVFHGHFPCFLSSMALALTCLLCTLPEAVVRGRKRPPGFTFTILKFKNVTKFSRTNEYILPDSPRQLQPGVALPHLRRHRLLHRLAGQSGAILHHNHGANLWFSHKIIYFVVNLNIQVFLQNPVCVVRLGDAEDAELHNFIRECANCTRFFFKKNINSVHETVWHIFYQ